MNMRVLVLKSHVKGHWRGGNFIKDYWTKKTKKPEPAPKKAKSPALKKQASNSINRMLDELHSFEAKHHMKKEGGQYQGSLFGGGSYGSSKVKDAKPEGFHPSPGPDGKKYPIYKTSKSTQADTWSDSEAVATMAVGDDSMLPDELNGVELSPWIDHPLSDEGWEFVDGINDELDEPDMDLPPGLSPAAGVVVEEPDGRVWIIHPTNGFAGYKATFPKGHADDGMSLQASAIKECFEESGLKVKITGFIGDVSRSQTKARYYRAVRVGGTPADVHWETQAVSLVPAGEVYDFVNAGVDKKVAVISGLHEVSGAEDVSEWEQVGHQKGSNDGGLYEDLDEKKWYCKFPKTADHAKNEVLACRLYQLAGVNVPAVKLIQEDGHVGVASEWRNVKQSKDSVTSGKLPGVFDGFAADVWLANWDVAGTGFDNLLVDENGKAVRIDAGGALLYRAQGSPKGKAFGDVPGELESLRSGQNPWSAAVFKDISDDDIREGVVKLSQIPAAAISNLVQEIGPGNPSQREKLALRLLSRRQYLIDKYLGGKNKK